MKRPINKKIILAISYEDYVFNSGGVNKVILAQSEIAMSHGYSVVYLCPFHVAKGLIGKSQWLVRVDNEIAMVGTDNDVLTYVGILSKDNYVISGIQIHHLKGINLDSLMNILNSITGNIYFYIHDYYTICPYASGNLLKDDDSLCEVIEGKTPKCKECSRFNGNTRLIREFIYCLSKRTKFIAPSESCKKIWTSYYKEFADKTIVIYHQKLVGNYYGCNEQLDLNSNVNLAFVGKQSSTKGWEDFKYIVSSLAGRSEYNFFCCGNGNEIVNKVKKIEIDFHNGLDAMTCALRDNKIDVVLLLSKWPETYSYTYYESIAANAYVLTYSCTGNICDQVLLRNNGAVFKDCERLIDFLVEKSSLINGINECRSKQLAPLVLEENDDFINLFFNQRMIIDYKFYGGHINQISSKLLIFIYRFENSVLKKRGL